MTNLNGDAPAEPLDGHQLVSVAQRARAAYGAEMSPADREAVFRAAPEILDDSAIPPSAEPSQTSQRQVSRSLCSFDL